MQLSKGKTLLISIFLISATFITTVFAASTANFAPTQTLPGSPVQFSLTIGDVGTTNLNRVELVFPQQGNIPVYQAREIGNPAGWTYETRYQLGAGAPYKIIWSTSGSGIAPGKTLTFNFAAMPPSVDGTFPFSWTTTDLGGSQNSGSILVTNYVSTLSKLSVVVPTNTKAGSEFILTVSALDQNGNKKSDYAGTVNFQSSDPQAILPSQYTFTSSDAGTHSFTVKLKTSGSQSITVSDSTLSNSAPVLVQQGDANYIVLSLDKSTVQPGSVVTATVWALDLYDNKVDVTNQSTFYIDSQAQGNFNKNVYTAQNIGNWTLVASYVSNNGQTLSDGKSLMVASSVQPTQSPTPTPTPQGQPGLKIVSDDLVNIPVNTTKTFSVTVKNTGNVDLKNVNLVFTGFSSNMMNITPSTSDIAQGKSKLFTASVFVSDKVLPLNVTFAAFSSDYPSDQVNATRVVTFNFTDQQTGGEQSSSTGQFTLSKNITYLGIAIVSAVILILLFWSIFLKEDGDKKKKPEKPE